MTQTAHAVTLRGSVEMVVEYFGFAVSNILYQRGVYPSEQFEKTTKYGMPLMLPTNAELNAYLGEVLQQIVDWVVKGLCRRLVLLLTEAASDAVVERWEFLLEPEAERCSGAGQPRKSEEEIRREVQAVMRQITSCVSFLPVLAMPCTFDLLVYTSAEAEAPAGTSWEPSGPRLFKNGCKLELKAFSTSHHRVHTNVIYRE